MTDKHHSKWTLDDYAKHYADILVMPPNGWGQHVSPIFGQSHMIMAAATRRFGEGAVRETFSAAVVAREREVRANG